ncbi:putative transcription repressor NiaR [bioreactor metagenome]|uniref:Putative transcription repressor NiaR n=1 Tax=bioreactor metagenome TaxID=1076179 RepID=A0A644T9A0_9ZZZZ
MDAKERRTALCTILKETEQPVTGTELAKMLGVSRQVIVGDIALLRAGGVHVYATPQGYVVPVTEDSNKITATLACRHTQEGLADELNIIVDNGGKVIDVVVEHPLYGEIRANLMLKSRREVAEFIDMMAESGATPLLVVTGGVHLHTVEVPNRKALAKIEEQLKSSGILMSELGG